jgi:putative ABC transport system substrate-binding protein
MRRRDFARGIAVFIACPFAAGAQALTVPVIGLLAPRSSDEAPNLVAAFRRGLNDIGLIEGQNVAIEYRYSDNHVERLPALAADLVSQNVTVIAAFSTLAARAAKTATSTIPIVFLTGDDPIVANLVASVNRPERNLTGVSFISATLGAKRLELLRALVPAGEPIAILVDPDSPESRTMSQDVQKAAQAIGQAITTLDVGTAGDIDAAFVVLQERRSRAALVTGSPFTYSRMLQFIAQAARERIAAMYAGRDYVAAGGLISYGPSIMDAYRQAGNYVGRIARGESIANLPVLLPTKFELVINLNTAKALGLGIPPTLLALADEVIE